MTTVQLADRIVLEAQKWIGTAYVHQASTLGAGCDCLGLLRGVWREIYGQEPQSVTPYTSDWDLVDRRDELLTACRTHLLQSDEIARGAVLIFRWRPDLPAKHLAIVSKSDRIIHAYERRGVVESPLGIHWKRRIAGIFRFPEIQQNT